MKKNEVLDILVTKLAADQIEWAKLELWAKHENISREDLDEIEFSFYEIVGDYVDLIYDCRGATVTLHIAITELELIYKIIL